MSDIIQLLIEQIRKLKRGGTEYEEYINKKWWLLYNEINKQYKTEKYIFCKQVYPVFTGLKFSLGEKE